jgi:hypothetical protein
MLQWKPHLRLLLVVATVLALAVALGSFDLANFLEW